MPGMGWNSGAAGGMSGLTGNITSQLPAALALARRGQGMAEGGDPVSFAGQRGMMGTPSGPAAPNALGRMAQRGYENDVIGGLPPGEAADYFAAREARERPQAREAPRRGGKGSPSGETAQSPAMKQVVAALENFAKELAFREANPFYSPLSRESHGDIGPQPGSPMAPPEDRWSTDPSQGQWNDPYGGIFPTELDYGRWGPMLDAIDAGVSLMPMGKVARGVKETAKAIKGLKPSEWLQNNVPYQKGAEHMQTQKGEKHRAGGTAGQRGGKAKKALALARRKKK
jgi:hypothetical protein